MEILLSDGAIIIYELIAIAAMIYFIVKISKEKKKKESLQAENAIREREELLNAQLINDKRR